MEALLIDEWLRGAFEEASVGPARAPILVLDGASLTVVRDRARAIGAEAGVPTEVIDRACLVATEIGTNHLRHARAGRIAMRPIHRHDLVAANNGHVGIEILGVDRGPGLMDVAGALDASAKARVEGSLGVGVGSIRRLSSSVDFDIRQGEGTRIIARVLSRECPREPEVGIYGRPFPGETVSGDHASFSRVGEQRDDAAGTLTMGARSQLVVAICDGLGHGVPAREAAAVAMGVFDGMLSSARSSPTHVLQACHPALEATRGVVMAVAALSFPDVEQAATTVGDGEERAPRTIELCSVGNIELQICAPPRRARRFGGLSAVVGGRGNVLPRLRSETTSFELGEVLVMTTDGIATKAAIDQELTLLREHPIVIAQRIMERWGRSTDDALVVVVR